MNVKRMFHVELFNAKGKSEELEIYFCNVVIPFFRERKFDVSLFITQYGLGPRHFWFVTGMEKIGFIDEWENMTMKNVEDKEFMLNLSEKIIDSWASIIKDVEPDITWSGTPGRMFHIEWFNALGKSVGVKEFILNELLPYWRKRGFSAKLYITQDELGPKEFWLITQIENFYSLDFWPKMAAGEPKGQKLLKKLLSMVSVPQASIVKELV